MDFFERYNEQFLQDSFKYFPVTAVTGPRQCGKSTLVKQFISKRKGKDNFFGGVYVKRVRN